MAAFLVGLGRAAAGALLFSLPILMTMEMWWLGQSMDPLRLLALVLVSLPLLFGLARFSGFEPTTDLRQDLAEVFVAITVATLTATMVLWVLGVFEPGQSPRVVIGMIVLQVVPGSIGALLSRSQFGQRFEESDAEESVGRPSRTSYAGELFVMGVGALFLSLNVAPTDEILRITVMMSPWQLLLLVLLSLAIMHALVYSVRFLGSHQRAEGSTFLLTFARFTVVGYAIVCIVSLGLLWLFGRTDGMGLTMLVGVMIVLAFPGAIGAAVARLVL
jgi:putative integral membrane protein (TIGR02587 family)